MLPAGDNVLVDGPDSDLVCTIVSLMYEPTRHHPHRALPDHDPECPGAKYLAPLIPAPPVGAASQALGSALAWRWMGVTVVGAPFDDLGGQDSGVVKVFDSTTGALLFLLPNPSPRVNDSFGRSVAISAVGGGGGSSLTTLERPMPGAFICMT